MTSANHKNNIGSARSTLRVCWELSLKKLLWRTQQTRGVDPLLACRTLAHRLRRWPIINPTVVNIPANTRRSLNGGWMLGHRLRRWPNIHPTVVSIAAKHETFTQWWVNVRPPSTTSAQHSPTTVWTSRVYWDLVLADRQMTHPVDTWRWINVGLTLVQRRRRWTNVKPTSIQRLVSAGALSYLWLRTLWWPV